jgi:hypothetical protein
MSHESADVTFSGYVQEGRLKQTGREDEVSDNER